MRILSVLSLFWVLVLGATAFADDTNPFRQGWILDQDMSELRFISLKRGNIAETNHFEQITGQIDETGNARVRVTLNSVETYLDIRNVRLRFMFFETFKHPSAEITVRIDRGSLNDLAEVKRKIVPMEYTLKMRDRQITRTERLAIFLIDEDTVSVSNADPIFVGVSDFDLFRGLKLLEEAASVSISPLAIVSFDFTFHRKTSKEGPGTAVEADVASATFDPNSVRITEWNAINPDEQTCIARFLTLGRLDSVRFESRSARINTNSMGLLEAYADAMVRCQTIRIRIEGLVARGEDTGGTLARQRAQAISRTLWARGVQRSRMTAEAGGRVTPSTEPVGGGRALITVLN
ncbi:MAG: OmpA family protein [Paracoccaceae bacterium]